MNAHRTACIVLAAALPFALGCAAKRPVLYPNGKLQNTGQAQARADIEDCFAQAEAYGAGGNPAGRVAGNTAAGAAVGGATAGVWGAVRGRDAGGRAAAGAAAGATAGLIRGMFRIRDPDPIQQRFVNTCLTNHGYQIIGWR